MHGWSWVKISKRSPYQERRRPSGCTVEMVRESTWPCQLGWGGGEGRETLIFSYHLSREIQNPRLSWIALHGLKNSWGKKVSIPTLGPARDFDPLRKSCNWSGTGGDNHAFTFLETSSLMVVKFTFPVIAFAVWIWFSFVDIFFYCFMW